MNRIKGKVALITGASAGIGAACAVRLARDGADLIVTARREERLMSLKNTIEGEHGVSVDVHSLDVRNRDEVDAFVERLRSSGRVPDILVNNAGLARGLAKLQEGDPRDWDEMIDTNVKGLLNVSRAVIPLMLQRDSGHIINIGSTAGHWVYPMGNVYNATKFAVRAITEGMNLDLVGTNLRVSSVDPGATETEFSEVRFHGDSEKAKKVYRGFKPLVGEDIAEVVAFVLNQPEHVSIQNVIVTPTAQRNPFVLHREE
jgi:3-hydroxy acid dehydrogenase/malonic semialdehyde reductase